MPVFSRCLVSVELLINGVRLTTLSKVPVPSDFQTSTSKLPQLRPGLWPWSSIDVSTFQTIEPFPPPMIEMEAYSLLCCESPPRHRVFINAACPGHPLAGTTPRFPSTRLSASKAATTAITSITSFRDDEETAACRGYQINLLTLSTRAKNRTKVSPQAPLKNPVADGP